MGRAVPKLLREPLRFASAGEPLKECMRPSVSATWDLVAGISIVGDSSYSEGTEREAWWLAILRRPPLEPGLTEVAKSVSSNAGMMIEIGCGFGLGVLVGELMKITRQYVNQLMGMNNGRIDGSWVYIFQLDKRKGS